jgi:hypothetical protein
MVKVITPLGNNHLDETEQLDFNKACMGMFLYIEDGVKSAIIQEFSFITQISF